MFVDVGECGTKRVILVHDVIRLYTGREGGSETRAITGEVNVIRNSFMLFCLMYIRDVWEYYR